MKSINLTYILLNYKISAQPCSGSDLLAGLENEIDVPVCISAFLHSTGQPDRSPTQYAAVSIMPAVMSRLSILPTHCIHICPERNRWSSFIPYSVIRRFQHRIKPSTSIHDLKVCILPEKRHEHRLSLHLMHRSLRNAVKPAPEVIYLCHQLFVNFHNASVLLLIYHSPRHILIIPSISICTG